MVVLWTNTTAGLLTMLCGKATRLTEMVLTGDKKYIAVLKFGREVDSSELENLRPIL